MIMTKLVHAPDIGYLGEGLSLCKLWCTVAHITTATDCGETNLVCFFGGRVLYFRGSLSQAWQGGMD